MVFLKAFEKKVWLATPTMHGFVTRHGDGRGQTNAYITGECLDVGMDLFNRGLCLPSDNKMTEQQQNVIIQLIRSCFQ